MAIVVGFHLLLQKSNLVPNSVAEFEAAQQLQCKDIYFHCGVVLVNIKWSKTRWIGNRVTMPLLKSKGPACPVSYLSQPHPQTLYLPFIEKSIQSSRLSVLTYFSLMLYLCHWLENTGYDAYRYSCHSLCQGGVSHAFAKNTPVHLIKHMGDWRSECYQQYLEDDLTLRLSATGGSLLKSFCNHNCTNASPFWHCLSYTSTVCFKRCWICTIFQGTILITSLCTSHHPLSH